MNKPAMSAQAVGGAVIIYFYTYTMSSSGW